MNLDYMLFSKINSLAGHSHYLDLFMVMIAKWAVLVYGIALVLLWFKKGSSDEVLRNRKGVLRICLSAAIALGINQVIGLFFFRPRPFATHKVTLLLDRSPDPSFPSDHATGATAITASFFGFNNTLGKIFAFISLLLVFSRVYSGTHYPFDILGGILTGLIGSFIAQKLWPYVDGIVEKLIGLWDYIVAKLFKVRGYQK